MVKKVEPPNWWVGLTQGVVLLLSGENLQATQVECSLPEVVVKQTKPSSNGDYLFVWLEFSPQLKSGTAVCRIITAKGQTSFEFPISSRKPKFGRNQGLALDDVIYLIMPDRFADGDPSNDEPAEFPGSHNRSDARAYHGGDLRGIKEHLPYLKDLGVTTLWLTPIVKNGAATDYHGYGAVDLYAVDPHLGTLREYEELVEAAHQQRMKVLFDVVPNHMGPLNPWVKDPPLPDWFHGTAEDHLSSSSPVKGGFYGQPEKKEITNDLFETLMDPHTPQQMRQNLTDGWFFGKLPDMNTENPMVVQYLIQNSIWWAETSGLDGYRIDTFPYVPRMFWSQWHGAVAGNLPAAVNDRRGLSSGPDRHIVLCRRAQGMGRNRYASDDGVRLSALFCVARCFVECRAGWTHHQYSAAGLAVSSPGISGFIFRKSRCAAVCERGG